MKRYYQFLAWIIAGMVLLLFLSGVIYKSIIGMELTTQLAAYGFVGLFALVFVLELIPQYFSPFMVSISALLFGLDPFAVCLVSVVASSVSSLTAFRIGRKLSTRFVEDIVNGGKKKEKNNSHNLTGRIINGWGRWIVLATALTPLPYFSMLFGAMRMKPDNFYLFGMVPRVAGYVLITLFMAVVL
ncbi:MAG: VTT domain-containing protein [archaeon]|jgi:membrane protein YqaA with SNARE-associated domain|nr:VTT domain-containing protein [archaeon]